MFSRLRKTRRLRESAASARRAGPVGGDSGTAAVVIELESSVIGFSVAPTISAGDPWFMVKLPEADR